MVWVFKQSRCRGIGMFLVAPADPSPFPFLLFTCSSMSIGFEAHRSVVGINEPVRLTVVARNDSSSSVPSMHIKIVQVCTWYARGHKESKTRTVASMIVPGSQLGVVQRAPEENNNIGHKTAAGKDAGLLYLQIVWPLGLQLVTRYPCPVTTCLHCIRA